MTAVLPRPTERLIFRRWTMEDENLALTLWGDMHVTALIGGKLDARTRLAEEIAIERAHRVQYWPVFSRSNDDFVGCCGLRPYRDVFELGVHLRAEHWGKGLAVEGARSVIDHAFGVLDARWIFAGHHPDNAASKRTLEKLGFRYTHDELYSPTGRMHPSYRLDHP
jgi:RimJ/RimL family protein N-acetyltransferase